MLRLKRCVHRAIGLWLISNLACSLGAGKDLPLHLTLGLSRTLEFPQGFKNLRIDDVSLFSYQQVLRSNGGMGLLLIPRRRGKSRLMVYGPTNQLLAHYEVEVAGEKRFLTEQKADERREGLRLAELNLGVGVPRRVDFSSQFGAVFLTSPGLVSYRRVTRHGGQLSLLLIPRRPGLTDLTVHSPAGIPLVKYYLNITR